MAIPPSRRIAIIGWPDSGKTRYLVSLNRLDGKIIGNWRVSKFTPRFTQFVGYWKDRVEATHRHEKRWLELDLFSVHHQQTGESITFTAWDVSGEVFHACFDSESEQGRNYLSTDDGKQLAAQFLGQLNGLAGLVFVFNEHVVPNRTRAYEHYSLVFNGLKNQTGGINYPMVLALSCSDLLPLRGSGDQAPPQWGEMLDAVEEHRTGKLTPEGLLDQAQKLGRSILRLPHLQSLELERQLDACTVKWCALPLSSLGDPEAIQKTASGEKFIDLNRVRPVGVEWPFQWLLERFEEEEKRRKRASLILWTVAAVLIALLAWFLAKEYGQPPASKSGQGSTQIVQTAASLPVPRNTNEVARVPNPPTIPTVIPIPKAVLPPAVVEPPKAAPPVANPVVVPAPKAVLPPAVEPPKATPPVVNQPPPKPVIPPVNPVPTPPPVAPVRPVAFTSEPNGAEFRVLDLAGKELHKNRAGVGPLSLPPGNYQVEFSHSWGDYFTASAKESLKLNPGSTTVTVHHAFPEGTVRVTSKPPGAQITLGGTNLLGQTGSTAPLNRRLPAGPHQIVATYRNQVSKSDIAISNGDMVPLEFHFVGRAQINSIPAGAEVWVNGQQRIIGASGGLDLLVGTHEIELRLAGHTSLKKEVTIVAGLSNRTLENQKLTPLLVAPPVKAKRWTNSLGMGFAHVPMPNGNILFCVHETRVQDFSAYAQEKGLDWRPLEHPKSGPQGDTHPAVNVSWEQATYFCEWLTALERERGRLARGQRYRLPTDEEWSTAVGLAAESGTSPAKRADHTPRDQGPWGRFSPQIDFTPPSGAGNYGPKAKTDNFEGTSPVGKFGPNKFGLYDLGGNAEEWCSDLFGTPDGVHVLRGSSWKTEPMKDGKTISLHPFISGFRFPASIATDSTGFRCVLEVGSTGP